MTKQRCLVNVFGYCLGEPEWVEEENRRRLGIFVDDPWWENIVATAKDLGIDVESIMNDAFVNEQ